MANELAISTYNIDLSDDGAIVIPTMQYDKNSRKCIFYISNKGEVITLSSDVYTVRIKYKNGDIPAYHDLTINPDGSATFTITDDMTQIAGDGNAQLVLNDAVSDRCINSRQFIIKVGESVFPNDEIVTTEQFDAITNLILHADASILEADAKTADCVAKTQDCVDKTALCVTATDNSNTATSNAITAKEACDLATTTANEKAELCITQTNLCKTATDNCNLEVQKLIDISYKTYNDVYYEYTHTEITDVSDRIIAILNDDVNTPINIIFTKNITLSKMVPINRKNVKFTGNITIYSGDFVGFAVIPSSTLVYYDCTKSDNFITLSNASDIDNFSLDDYIYINYVDDNMSLISKISNIENDKITLADYPDFTGITTTYKIAKFEYMNIIFSGLTFKKNITTFTNQDIGISTCSGVTINNCSFENCYGLTMEHVGYSSIYNSYFYNCTQSCYLKDICHINIHNNKYNYNSQNIRCQFVYCCSFTNNEIYNGKSPQYTVGIEISSVNMTTNKASSNIISNNKCIGVNVGRLGSGIGGIHLNYYAHDNVISDNLCNNNGIGIYLENYCSNNTIQSNECNHNGGLYGVGIQLDWNCNYNTITGNQCNYNNGDYGNSTEQVGESCGIEIRTGIEDEHTDIGNVVSANTCIGNGRSGMMISGKDTIVSNNTVSGNGTNNIYTITAEILIITATSGLSIIGNSINSNSKSKYGIYIYPTTQAKSTFVTIMNNMITATSHNTSAVLVVNSDDTKIVDNIINSAAIQRTLYATGISSDNKMNNVIIKDNIVNSSNTSYPTIELCYINGYDAQYNFINRTKVTGTINMCTNSYN